MALMTMCLKISIFFVFDKSVTNEATDRRTDGCTDRRTEGPRDRGTEGPRDRITDGGTNPFIERTHLNKTILLETPKTPGVGGATALFALVSYKDNRNFSVKFCVITVLF